MSVYVTQGWGAMTAGKNQNCGYKVSQDLYADIYKFVRNFVWDLYAIFVSNLYTIFIWCIGHRMPLLFSHK